MNYKMTIQYDGSRYSGWQRQGNTEQTIQARLEKTLTELLGAPVEISGSGRTDAGVHALGQVASFQTECAVEELDTFLIELNRRLPGDIAVTRLTSASPRFHARLSAKEKIYRYTVWNSEIPDVFARRYQYQLPEPLDLSAMEEGARLLLGTHDFSGFSTGRTKKSTVRSIRSVEIRREGERVTFLFRGNGFLRNMVRIMTGTLLEIGLGHMDPTCIKEILESGDRQKAGPTAPPQGLCLIEVIY